MKSRQPRASYFPFRSSYPQRKPGPARRRTHRRLLTEVLEDRRVLATWIPAGPGPILGGQVENVSPDNSVAGAIHAVVTHPTDADTVYVGAVNGGVWKTTNATATKPAWVPLTDDASSLSIGDLEMDPMDSETLIAGIGRASSFGQEGGGLTGLMLTRDGGNTWTELQDPLLQDNAFSAVFVRNDLILAASNGGFKDFLDFNALFGVKSGGLFRSADGGATWTSIEVLPRTNEAPDEPVQFNAYDLIADPTDPSRFYMSLQDTGIFVSKDFGQTWDNISNSSGVLRDAIQFVETVDADGNPVRFELPGANTNTEMAIGDNGRLFVGVIEIGQVEYIGFTDDQGSSWEQMDLPTTPDGAGGAPIGLQPRQKAGAQGSIHFSIAVDPSNPDIVYVGGDRQETNTVDPFGNSIGANDFSGRLFRGNINEERQDLNDPLQIVSPQWDHLTHRDDVIFNPDGGTASISSPHADSRGIAFDANGDLIEVDDGGVFRRTSPLDNTGDWFSLNSNLQITEIHDIAYDSISNIIVAGTQDVGTVQQIFTGGTTWEPIALSTGGIGSDPFRLSAECRGHCCKPLWKRKYA